MLELDHIKQDLFEVGTLQRTIGGEISPRKYHKHQKQALKLMKKADKTMTAFIKRNAYADLSEDDKGMCKYIYELSENLNANEINLNEKKLDYYLETGSLLVGFGVPPQMKFGKISMPDDNDDFF